MVIIPGTDSQSSSKAIIVQSFREMDRERKREDTEGEGAAEAEETGRQRRREGGGARGRLRRREKGGMERERETVERVSGTVLFTSRRDLVMMFSFFFTSS